MKIVTAVLALGLVAGAFAAATTPTTPPAAPAKGYHASKKSDVYHLPACASAKSISKENLVVFASKEEAQKKDYRPCAVCKP
jgi:competence protein ComEC